MQVFYSDEYVLAAHGFDTTRKAKWIADSLGRQPMGGVDLTAPEPLSEDELLRIHDPEYITAVKAGEPRHLAEGQGFVWDPGLWPMVCASNGGAVAAAKAALKDGVAGSLSSGLHHAYRDHGSGFCTYNGLALAALTTLDGGIQSVLVLDLDAHCGGGTHSLVSQDHRIRQIDIATSSFDHYQPAGYNTLDLIDDPEEYLPTLSRRLKELATTHFDLCLYNAGMDVDQRSSIGGARG